MAWPSHLDTSPDRVQSALRRQLDELGLTGDALPDNLTQWQALLEAVAGRYSEVDESRRLLEDALRAVSIETREPRAGSSGTEHRDTSSEEHYQHLFEMSPIPTWEEDFTGVGAWLDGLRESGVTDLGAHLADNPAELAHGVSLIHVANVNAAASRLVGAKDEASMLGPLDPRLINDDSAPSFIAQLVAMWDGTGSVRRQFLGSRLDGSKYHGILHWHVPLIGRVPDHSHVLVKIVDITEQVDAEEKVRELLKSKDEFLASISHELRTPLTSVLGFAELLRSMGEESDDEERDSLLEIIATQASDLSDLVEDLLTAARSELGQLTIAEVPVDIHAQIAQVRESRARDDREIRVSPRPEEGILARGDPQRVRQILRNLVTNAEKYGGPHIEVCVEVENGEALVRVLDDGAGLGPGSQERVFERYYRSPENEDRPGSVGIGLTISRDMARQMGGDLTYRRIDDWTAFDLRLPLLVDHDRSRQQAAGPTTSG